MSTPIIFKSLQMRNFLSFGNQLITLDLSDPGSTLIIGENVDTNSNNGAGKTTIINAICYALFNKAFDTISLQRLINTTNHVKNTQMEVHLEFIKGENTYIIHRYRGEMTDIKITMNGEDITLDSVTNNDNAVEEIIGISYELFTRIIIFSGNSIPFLLMPVSQQRQQIEELFNITLLSQKAIKLKEIIKTTEGSIGIQESVIKEREAQISTYEKQLTAADHRVNKWHDDRTRQITTLERDLESLKDFDMATEKEFHSLVAELERSLGPQKGKLSLAKKDQTTILGEIKKLNAELDHLTDEKCPYCLQKYAGAGDKLEEKKELLLLKNSQSGELAISISALTETINELTRSITEAKDSMRFPSLEAAIRAEAASQTAQQKIDDLNAAENPHVDAFENLKKNAIKKISYEQLDSLKRDLEHQQFLLKLLTDKNSFIRRRIINRTIPFLNKQLIHYTRELGLPHIVKFDDDMSCSVTEYGRELDFGNLSSGEKKRVNFSLAIAFRDVLHHLHSRINCLFIDEIDNSLDTSGVECMFKLIKQKTHDECLSTWVISHRPEAIGRFDRTIVVRKQNGFSRVVIDNELEKAA